MTREASVRITVGYALAPNGRAAIVADLAWGEHTRRLEAVVDATTEEDACLAAATLSLGRGSGLWRTFADRNWESVWPGRGLRRSLARGGERHGFGDTAGR
jgi:hypothetical protein